jgi:hypothetical protein
MNSYVVLGDGKTDANGNLAFGSTNATAFQFIAGFFSYFFFSNCDL